MFREYKTRVFFLQNPGRASSKPGSSKNQTRVAQIERPAELIHSIEMNVTEWAGTDTAPSLTGSDVSYGFTRSCPISL